MAFIGKFIGRLAGALPGGGDRALHDWVLARLDLRPGDRVLEIGCGPGAAMKRMLKTGKDVYVVGADISEEAIGQAWEKNARAIRAGRAMLVQTDLAGGLPAFTAPFTRAVAVNAEILANRPVEVLKAVRRSLAPGGKIAVAVQPREKGSTEATARMLGKEIRRQLEAAGFATVRLHEKTMKPAAAVCVTGVNPKNAKSAPPV